MDGISAGGFLDCDGEVGAEGRGRAERSTQGWSTTSGGFLAPQGPAPRTWNQAGEAYCTLRSHLKTSNEFPEFTCLLMGACEFMIGVGFPQHGTFHTDTGAFAASAAACSAAGPGGAAWR